MYVIRIYVNRKGMRIHLHLLILLLFVCFLCFSCCWPCLCTVGKRRDNGIFRICDLCCFVESDGIDVSEYQKNQFGKAYRSMSETSGQTDICGEERNMARYSRCILICMLIISGCDSYLDTLYSSSNQDYLVNLIRNAQDDASGLFEKSLSTSFYATEALSVSGVGIPHQGTLCSSLGSSKFSSWEELYNLMVTKSRIPKCLDSIKDATRTKLTDGLRGTKLSKVYYAVASIHTLVSTKPSLFDATSLNLLEIAKHIKSFQLPNTLFTEQIKSTKSKSSIHKTSMALSAVAKVECKERESAFICS